ncbi:MAG: GGDEF domain-containing protein [Clostridia bacterium]|nr:GGDEF domain-containing protein [Clostridia bacterium]
MIPERRKRIGVFLNASDMYFSGVLYDTFRERARAMNADLVFFTSIDYRIPNTDGDPQERELFRFAPVEDLDGLILVPDSYEVTHNREALEQEIRRRARAPIVSLRSMDSLGDCVFMDEKRAIRPLVRHLIEEHGIRRLAYLGGFPGHLPTQQREDAFREEIRTHGLTFDEQYFMRGNMWYSSGPRAYAYFFEKLEEPPEAIVCANDYMACGLIEELQRHGIRVPEDVIVTGFDHSLRDGQGSVSLTTIEQDYREMAERAVLQLEKRMNGEDTGEAKQIGISGRLILGESCGCGRNREEGLKALVREQERRINDMYLREFDITYLSLELAECDSVSQLRETLDRKAGEMPGQRDYYLCLFEEEQGEKTFFAERMTDRVRTAAVIRDGKARPAPKESMDRRQLLPGEAWESDTPQVFLLSMLYLREQMFGYSVIRYAEGFLPNVYYQHRDIIITGALRNIRNHQMLRALYEERRIASITDPLTGLYNRRGLEEQIMPRWEEYCAEELPTAFVYFDMDYLKQINDRFGHAAGDEAICLMARAVREAVPAGTVYARMGGDEFLAVLPGMPEDAVRELMNAFEERLDRLQEKEEFPFQVQSSIGAYQVKLRKGITMQQCILRSDKMMYEIKRQRHEKGSPR